MRGIDLPACLALARRVAREAGALTLRHFRGELRVEIKADDTPVTVADREAEMLIRSAIGDAFPGHGILGEEHGYRPGTEPLTWVVDPIDGTRSFINGVPLYAVLVALVEGAYDGSTPIAADRSLVGVIHVPALDETLAAARGLGCHLNGAAVAVSDRSDPERARVTTSDFFDLARRAPALWQTLSAAPLSRTWGDAYGYVLVASGRFDVMVDPVVSPWDIAPMPVIMEEAGGFYGDLSGRRLITTSAVATTRALAARLFDSPRDAGGPGGVRAP